MFPSADHFTITRPGGAPEIVGCEASGFEHEIREVHRCLREGRIESPQMTHAETLNIMHTADSLRALWGMKYPGE
jgi:dihydrodiol dehydrogenase / D-xylose 1-dehydrogenase (NADP)